MESENNLCHSEYVAESRGCIGGTCRLYLWKFEEKQRVKGKKCSSLSYCMVIAAQAVNVEKFIVY